MALDMALAKLPAERISIEFLNVHYRGEVFSGEPTTALVLVVSADVTGVATGVLRPVHRSRVSFQRS